MYLPSHIAAGLVIGKISGDYTIALIGSLTPDLDHFYSYVKHGAHKSWKGFVELITNEEDPYDDQRNIFHNIFLASIIAIIFALINFKAAALFALAYFIHLAMDALDGAEYYPLYPNKKINLRGPVGFFSKYDIAVSIFLVIIFLALNFII